MIEKVKIDDAILYYISISDMERIEIVHVKSGLEPLGESSHLLITKQILNIKNEWTDIKDSFDITVLELIKIVDVVINQVKLGESEQIFIISKYESDYQVKIITLFHPLLENLSEYVTIRKESLNIKNKWDTLSSLFLKISIILEMDKILNEIEIFDYT